MPGGHGLTTRGAESGYGPVRGTRLEHTTIHLTGDRSEGFDCHGGCNPAILRMRNNIVQAVQKVGFADGSFDEDHNLYWGGERRFRAGPHSRVAEPRFVDDFAGDLHLGLGSPAADLGAPLGVRSDLDGRTLPLDGDRDGTARPDAGAFERGGRGVGLTVHADRGSSMTSKPVAMLLADLGVTKTHWRDPLSSVPCL